ncbi:MAG: type II toxin-antitoxin system RelE/ParE family toxin [Treponema sp.]|nr:type II toxin-antitoxin system RelE/ParE family toxin [Treponema sp.]MEE3314985.1 type II toxin-antitoxin system RelE/ParE family toxin [Treponema sp.]
MKREFIETPSFTKKWFSLGFTDDDLAELQQFLIMNPDAGDTMVGTGGLKKIRYAFKGRGKSGSARVCYVDFASFEKNYLIQVFSKDEKSNLTDAEKNAVKKVVTVLKSEAAKNWGQEHE